MKMKDYITFPTYPQDIRKVKAGFFSKTGFPNVIGVIDGTLIPSKHPVMMNPCMYFGKGIMR